MQLKIKCWNRPLRETPGCWFRYDELWRHRNIVWTWDLPTFKCACRAVLCSVTEALLCVKGSCVILPQHCTKLCNVCVCIYICGYRETTFHKQRLWLKWRELLVVWRAFRLRLAETACRRWMATTTALNKQSWITYCRWSTGWRHSKGM